MAVTSFWYGQAFVNAFNKRIDFDSDAIKVAMLTSAYVPNQDTHAFFSDLTNEIVGTGYTAGGIALATPTITYTGATNVLKLSGSNVSWATSTLTSRFAVVYDSSGGSAATNCLLTCVNFGADVSSSGSTFTITWDALGIAQVTVA